MRGIGAVEALRALLPDIAAVLFALVTQLGDVWFVFLVLTVLYWVGLPGSNVSRPRAALLIGLALGGLALTAGLKQFFKLPRPPMPGGVVGLRYVPNALHGAYIDVATASGYGFPSGHALLSTVVWGGLALVLDVWTRRRRALVAGIVIALVGFSRVALGVHYAVDVVAGVAVGLGYLAGIVGVARGHTRVAFWTAAAIAVASVVVGTVTFDDAATLGTTVGAAVAWELFGGRVPESPHSRRTGITVAAVGLAVFGGVFGVVYALKPPFVVTVLASATVLAGTLVLPLVAERIEKRVLTAPR
jgi:membrane-associated phospholipid phosphatase